MMDWDAYFTASSCFQAYVRGMLALISADKKNGSGNHDPFQPGQAGDDASGWKAKGWNLEKPDWTGKLKLISVVLKPGLPDFSGTTYKNGGKYTK
jgi:hypothetical protein